MMIGDSTRVRNVGKRAPSNGDRKSRDLLKSISERLRSEPDLFYDPYARQARLIPGLVPAKLANQPEVVREVIAMELAGASDSNKMKDLLMKHLPKEIKAAVTARGQGKKVENMSSNEIGRIIEDIYK